MGVGFWIWTGVACPRLIKGVGRLFRKQKQIRCEVFLGINPFFSWDCVGRGCLKRKQCGEPRFLY